MPANLPKPTRKSWPYVIAVALVLGFNSGWPAADIIKLTGIILVLIALISSAGPGNET
ncbi:hypothetical protein AB0D92_30325 [Streptomyces parvus]|uniref:hypothetical protein n=1 Tax=Streptomyces parvus TaxID=66428 RepID=UPI0033C6CAEC